MVSIVFTSKFQNGQKLPLGENGNMRPKISFSFRPRN